MNRLSSEEEFRKKAQYKSIVLALLKCVVESRSQLIPRETTTITATNMMRVLGRSTQIFVALCSMIYLTGMA